MGNAIMVYHIAIFDITKDTKYSKYGYELPEAEESVSIREIYSFKTLKERDDKHRELTTYIAENKDTFGVEKNKGVQIMAWNSRLEF